MRFNDKIALLMVSLLGMNSVFVSDCNAYGISAVEIYKQAKAGNKNYLGLLNRYNNAIDLTDKNGYTAYCLALKNDDKNTLSVLSRFGANKSHRCVKQVELDKLDLMKFPNPLTLDLRLSHLLPK